MICIGYEDDIRDEAPPIRKEYIEVDEGSAEGAPLDMSPQEVAELDSYVLMFRRWRGHRYELSIFELEVRRPFGEGHKVFDGKPVRCEHGHDDHLFANSASQLALYRTTGESVK